MGDLMLRGGHVVDGSVNASPVRADVLVVDGRIAEIAPPGTVQPPAAACDVDCTDHVVAPGFVDIHTHSDLTRLSYPDAESRVRQGITTEVVGNCGMSPAPVGPHGAASLRATIGPVDLRPDVAFAWDAFGEYLQRVETAPSAVNTAALVGHGSLRHAVMGSSTTTATARERSAIAALADEALSAGAWGVSFGLMYAPGENAGADELAAVARVAADRDALVAAHVRAYLGSALHGAVDELVSFADGSRIQVSHLRAIGSAGRGVASEVLDGLHARRAAGVDVAADAYPYTAGHTTAIQLLPDDLRRGGTAEALSAIRRDRGRVRAELERLDFGPAAITIARTGAAPTAACGRTLAELAGGEAGWADVLLELLDRHDGVVDVIVVGSDPEDVAATLHDPLVSIGSDGATLSCSHTANMPHPRSFGTFPRALRLLLDGGMRIGEAVAKATSLPAERLGLRDRGRLVLGAAGDIVVLDPAKLADLATYAAPSVPPTGVRDVFVAGEAVVRAGTLTAARPGRLLRSRR